MICLNKTERMEEAALRHSLEKRLRSESISVAGILSLPMSKKRAKHWRLLRCKEFAHTPGSVSGLAGIRPVFEKLIAYLGQHWSQWTAPLRRELAAADYWAARGGNRH